MKKNCILALALVPVIAVSCNKNEEPETPAAGNDKINITVNVAALSKSPDLDADGKGNFVDGDIFNLVVSGENTTANSIDFTVGTTSLTWSGLNLADDVKEVNFSAYYPKQNMANDGTFEFNIAEAEYKDLLLSESQKVTVGSEAPVNITFRHATHKLNISYSSDFYSADELVEIQTVCNAKSTCTVDAVSGTIKEVLSASSDFSAEGTSVSYLLVPQATDGIELNIKLGQISKTYNLKELLAQTGNPQDELIGGKQIDISLKVSKDVITVEDAVIGAWEDQATVDGDIVIE